MEKIDQLIKYYEEKRIVNVHSGFITVKLLNEFITALKDLKMTQNKED